MQASFVQIIICLLIGIALIVVLTSRYRVHAFFALLLAAFVVGLGVGLPVDGIITAVKDGFGNVMKSLAIIIVLGTTLGVLLEHTGSTQVMAAFIMRKVGEKRSALAMTLTGFIVGLPIFCDSGYIVLSGLNRSLARRTHTHMAVMAVSLATGLYSVHCLIPPHPGASAAAGIIGVDFGRLIMMGIIVAIPASAAGYLWANYMGKKMDDVVDDDIDVPTENKHLPSSLKAFLPVVVPILLISLKSFLVLDTAINNKWLTSILSLGDPVLALAVGILLALNCKRGWDRSSLGKLLTDGAEKAGGILVIIGAGGAFGAVLAATKIGDHLNGAFALGSLGILFPFLVAFILKTAQGSSTVAIITASSIILPLLPALGLDTPNGHLLTVLAMGGGSMMISHANDAYFWVIAKFSGLELKSMLRVYSVATVLMGITSLVMVYILSTVLA
ncbi:GntP family permease [Mucilaginibacter calamicampi]|uniref:GntP family permease n=1 Tax=Mucilaginibacter calamicampi TaxID=1302352 RepID=A0ABW2YWL4_9SPHI